MLALLALGHDLLSVEETLRPPQHVPERERVVHHQSIHNVTSAWNDGA
jgi:hypothetical protein